VTSLKRIQITGNLNLPGGPMLGMWTVFVTTPQCGIGVKKNATLVKPWRDTPTRNDQARETERELDIWA
jgi:hypothetical protein